MLAVQTGFAQDKLSDLFGKLEGKENVTQVTITKSMLSMMPNISSSAEMNGVDIKNIVNKLEQIDIFSSEDKETSKLMAKEAKEHFNNLKSYEVLMKIKGKKDNVLFYGEKKGNIFTSLIMFVDGDDNCTLIRLSGKFTTQDIQDVTKAIEK
jgi:hypothetical protein